MKSTRSKLGSLIRQPQARAFTLAELLVVIAMLAVLVSFRLTALARARALTKAEQCAANLRQSAEAMRLYASEHNDSLPSATGGFWVWDLPVETTDALRQFGATRTTLYCPANPGQNANGLWNYGGFRVLGYAMALDYSLLTSTNRNFSIHPQPISIAGVPVSAPPLASKKVLMADATISLPGQSNPALKNAYQYIGINGGYTEPGWTGHRTSHLLGPIPSGGNLAMLDGHVEWRSFAVMTPRTDSAAGGPVFWW